MEKVVPWSFQTLRMSKSPDPRHFPKTFFLGIAAFLIMIAAGGIGYVIGLSDHQDSSLEINYQTKPQPQTPSPTNIPANPEPTTKESQTNKNNKTSIKPVLSTATLSKIKYTLPTGWTARINDRSLVLSSEPYLGHISIEAYDYSPNIDSRDLFCAATNECTTKTTFAKINIGNLSGYSTVNTKNGGGSLSQYFGAIGNKFYSISILNPSASDEFDKTYQSVLDSLVF